MDWEPISEARLWNEIISASMRVIGDRRLQLQERRRENAQRVPARCSTCRVPRIVQTDALISNAFSHISSQAFEDVTQIMKKCAMRDARNERRCPR